MPKKRLLREIGKNIVAERKKCGLSQKTLAAKLDITYESLSRIERGITAPSVIRLGEIAHVLGCPLSALFQTEAIKTKERAYDIADDLETLSLEQQNAVLNLMYTNIHTFKKINES